MNKFNNKNLMHQNNIIPIKRYQEAKSPDFKLSFYNRPICKTIPDLRTLPGYPPILI